MLVFRKLSYSKVFLSWVSAHVQIWITTTTSKIQNMNQILSLGPPDFYIWSLSETCFSVSKTLVNIKISIGSSSLFYKFGIMKEKKKMTLIWHKYFDCVSSLAEGGSLTAWCQTERVYVGGESLTCFSVPETYMPISYPRRQDKGLKSQSR